MNAITPNVSFLRRFARPQPGILAGFCLLAGSVFAQPTVSNVTASQMAGTRSAAITYTLSHAQSLPCAVTMLASRDNGVTWETVASTTGALGAGITSSPSGLTKAITWNGGNDWPPQLFLQAKVRITANDGQGNGGPPTGFALIPAGTYTMGSADDYITTTPHAVTLPAFYLAKTETMYADWVGVRTWAIAAARGANAYDFSATLGAGKGDLHPVHTVSWYDVVKWCNAKSEMEGLVPVYYINDAQTLVYRTGENTTPQPKLGANGYRLPTEAEWEYGARGGLSGQLFPSGNTITYAEANYAGHPTYATGAVPWTSPVGALGANGYGLHDMAGNVAEWCLDFLGSYGDTPVTSPVASIWNSSRMYRGGNCTFTAQYLRCAARYWEGPELRATLLGFRTARSLVQ